MKTKFILFISLFLSARIIAREIYVTDYGAVGDGKTLNTIAIQHAIDACAAQGGGRVVIPAGVYLTGTIRLKSRIHLALEAGAVLKGSPNLRDYTIFSTENDTVYYGILYTEDAEQVILSGPGAIDGNDTAFFVWDKAKTIEHAGLQYARQGENFRRVESGIGDGPVVPKKRPRQMIIFARCRDITVKDIKLVHSPFWTLHFADCDGVIVSNVKLWASMEVPNADGIDVTSSSNVIISDCDIRSGDDCIAITGYDHHFELPGFSHIRHVSENILVTNCHLMSRSSGIRIGGLDQNSMRNCIFSNLTITHSNRGIGLFVRDQGSIENMLFSHIVIETRLHTGDWWGHGEPIHLSAIRGKDNVVLGKIRNIQFSDILCQGESGILLYGTEESPIENVTFQNITFHLKSSPLNDVAGGNIDLRPALEERFQLFSSDIPGFLAQYVQSLTIQNFRLTWDPMTHPFFTHGLAVVHFDTLTINGFQGSASPSRPELAPIFLKKGRKVHLENVPKGIIHKESVQ